VRSGGIPAEISEELGLKNGHRQRSVPPPITHTGNELRQKVFPPVRWAIPEMLAEGVTLFGGREKMGKSWLALGLCIATATGGYALGKVPVEQGESLYISLEDNERRLQDRVKTLTDEDTDLDMLHYAAGWLRSDEGGTEQLDMFLTDHPDTRLVVVDTLKKIRPYTSGRRNMYDVDYEAIEPFVGLASQHNVAIVLVHHLNQNPDPADPYDAFSGSSGLTAAVEGILLLTRERGQADGYLTVDGKDIKDRQELALGWDANVCTWTIQGEAEQYKLSKARQEILHIVEITDEPVTPTYVADALGKNFNAVKKTMWEMSRDGQLSSTGSGRYTLVTGNPGNPSNLLKAGSTSPVTEVTEVTAPTEEPNGHLWHEEHTERRGG
jgi:hypothetical protein